MRAFTLADESAPTGCAGLWLADESAPKRCAAKAACAASQTWHGSEPAQAGFAEAYERLP